MQNFVIAQDYHASGNGRPQLDESQDWTLISASESDGHTQLQFSRKLNTCDEDDDVAITVNCITIETGTRFSDNRYDNSRQTPSI